MFNSVVFDVFIGMVLIYLLYSLLITIVSEIVVSWIGLRSRMLRVSIEKMLNDGYYDHRQASWLTFIWFVIQRFFLKEFKEFKHSLAGKFYEYPAIKYLGARAGERRTWFTETKPSYFSDEIFADTLIQMFKDKGSGKTDMEKIKFCLAFNTYMVQPATLKRLRDLAANSGDDMEAFKKNLKSWYNETQDRTTGWYKRKVQLILFWLGFLLAVIFNVDSLRIARILAKDEKARDQLVAIGIEMAKDTARYAAFLKNSDTTLPQNVLDTGYARITKDIEEANLVLGLGWGTDKLKKPLTETVDSKYEDKFSKLSDQVAIFQASAENVRQRTDSLIIINNKIDSALEKFNTLLLDSLKTGADSIYHRELDTVRKYLVQYRANKKRDSLILVHSSTRLNEVHKEVNNTLNAGFVAIDSINAVGANSVVVKGHRRYHAFEKFFYVLDRMWRGYRIVGFIITGLMLSLGAPFWFDLLKKLVSIRGDGVKPEEKKLKNTEVVINEDKPLKTSPAPSTGFNVTGDSVDEALKIYHDLIRKIPGVKSVFTARDLKSKEKIIQVNVDTNETKEEVNSKFPVLRLGGVRVPHVVKVSGTPVSNAREGIIINKSGANGPGTLGCQLKRTDTGETHILSCWHVMKGDRMFSNTDNLNTILDHNDVECAQRWAGGIHGAFDYAIASYPRGANENFNDFLKQKLGISGAIRFRAVDRSDIEKTLNVKYFDALEGKVRKGFIFANTAEVTINYFDMNRVVFDVLMITTDEEKSISQGGNSGSIIFDDKKNVAIAMIISGDDNYTYAVKLSHIFGIHDEMIIA